ncbi:MAG: 3-keto-disaccharide hydrolase [Opitutales bacterium]
MKSFRTGSTIVFTLFVALFTLHSTAVAGEWRSLFNGENLDGWVMRGEGKGTPTFEVKDGKIIGSTLVPRNKTAFVATPEEYKDFELVYDAWVENDLNSGVQVRSTAEGNVKGPQVELDNGSPRTGFIFGQGGGGWVSDMSSPPREFTSFKPFEWNTFRVRVEGQRIQVWINDVQVEDVTSERVPETGVIALQVHGYPRGKKNAAGAKEITSVAWKNIKIREL